MQQYGGNFFIVTGPATGYGQLTRLGLTPVFIRPWNDLDTDRTAEGGAAAWGNMSKKRRGGKRPDTEAITRAKKNNRALLPLEVTQKVWSNFTETVEMAGPEGWMRASIARLLPADQTLAASLPRLAALAALQLDEGYITSARLQALSIGGEAASSALADVEEEEPDIAEALRTEFPGAQLVVRVRARRIFPNCPRYIHRMQLVEASPYVPDAAGAAPVPAWKRFEMFRDVLPRDDAARDDDAG